MSTKREKRSAVCPVCGKSVRIYVPAGGDGSVDVFQRHKGVRPEWAPCKGSRRDAEPRKLTPAIPRGAESEELAGGMTEQHQSAAKSERGDKGGGK